MNSFLFFAGIMCLAWVQSCNGQRMIWTTIRDITSYNDACKSDGVGYVDPPLAVPEGECASGVMVRNFSCFFLSLSRSHPLGCYADPPDCSADPPGALLYTVDARNTDSAAETRLRAHGLYRICPFRHDAHGRCV